MIFQKTQSGSSLLELIVALGVFTVGIVTVLFLVWGSSAATQSGVERTQALYLAREGLEAVRTIRDTSFDNLVDGTHGIGLSDGKWNLITTPDAVDQFDRTITIATGTTPETKKITSTVSWPVSPVRNESVELIEYVTHWDKPPMTEIDCFDVDLSGASIEQGSVHKIVRYIWISNPSCGYSVTLDKIQLYWDIPTNNIFKVRIDSFFKWQGSAVSGTILDLEPNETLESGAPAKEIDQLRWVKSILGTDIDVKFIMSDGSSAEFTIPAFTE